MVLRYDKGKNRRLCGGMGGETAVNQKQLYDRKTACYPGGTKWLWFYLFIRLPLGILFGGILLFRQIFKTFGASGAWWNRNYLSLMLAAIGLGTVLLILRILVYMELRTLSPGSYRKNLWLLGCETVILAWNAAAEFFNAGTMHWRDFLGLFLIALVICVLAWFVTNFIYFRKRKMLFEMELPASDGCSPEGGMPEAPQARTESAVPPQEPASCDTADASRAQEEWETEDPVPCGTLSCPYCGALLTENGHFCRRCGNPVEKL